MALQIEQPIAIELRLLGADERQLARRLAALDDAPELDGEVLVALVGGRAVAALSLADRRVVADPFVPNTEPVALLQLRAAQLSVAGRRRARRVLRPRLAYNS